MTKILFALFILLSGLIIIMANIVESNPVHFLGFFILILTFLVAIMYADWDERNR